MEPSWKQADVFPVIARLIEAAREQQQEQQSLEWLASNMVSWFSQRITVGESDWSRAFERTKINRLWAYKPSVAGNP